MFMRLSNQRGSAMLGALMITMALGFMGMAMVELSASDEIATVQEHHSTLAMNYGTAGLEWARNQIDNGFDPTVTDKEFGIGYFSVFTDATSGTVTVTSRVGAAKRSQSIGVNYGADCMDLDVSGAYTSGKYLKGVKLVKTCNTSATVTDVQMTWNVSECVTDASCSTDYNDYLDSNGKLVFCHVPPGNPSAAQTHHGSTSSWENGHDSANHESTNHNQDYLGECGTTCVQKSISEADIAACEDDDEGIYIEEIVMDGATIYDDGNEVNEETGAVECGVAESDDDEASLMTPSDLFFAVFGVPSAHAKRSSSSDDHDSDDDDDDHDSDDDDEDDDDSSSSSSSSTATATSSSSSTSTSTSSETDDTADDDDEVYDYDSTANAADDEADEDHSGSCVASTRVDDGNDDNNDTWTDPDDDGDEHKEDDEQINVVHATCNENKDYEFNYIKFNTEQPGGGLYELKVSFQDGSSISKEWVDGVGVQGETGQYEIDSGSVIVAAGNTVQIDVLGSAITCGAGGPAVNASMKLGVDGVYSTLFSGSDVDGGESYSTTTGSAESVYTVRSTASLDSCNHFSRTITSTDTVNVKTLVNGDQAPALAGFGGQKPVLEFLASYLDSQGRVVLDSNQIIMLFELGVDVSQNPASTAADFQDLVVLFTLTQN